MREITELGLRGKLAQTGSVAPPSTLDEWCKRHEEWSRIFGKIAKDAEDAGLKPQ